MLQEYYDDYPNVFTFVCGLTGLASSEMYQFIYTKLTSFRYTHGIITAMRCIHESKHNTNSVALQLVSPFSLNMLGHSLLPYDCLCLSNILSCYSVTQLNMGYCRIGNNGAEMLMKHYTKSTTCQLLKELNLKGNDLTSEGMVHMMKIIKISKFLY